MVKPFTSYPGIKSVVSGYSGGHVENPTYEQVCTNQAGHVEAVQIEYDPNITTFENILDVYFKTFDPTDDGGQFFDRGESYQPVILSWWESTQSCRVKETTNWRRGYL